MRDLLTEGHAFLGTSDLDAQRLQQLRGFGGPQRARLLHVKAVEDFSEALHLRPLDEFTRTALKSSKCFKESLSLSASRSEKEAYFRLVNTLYSRSWSSVQNEASGVHAMAPSIAPRHQGALRSSISKSFEEMNQVLLAIIS